MQECPRVPNLYISGFVTPFPLLTLADVHKISLAVDLCNLSLVSVVLPHPCYMALESSVSGVCLNSLLTVS